jgi:hypothetical protein
MTATLPTYAGLSDADKSARIAAEVRLMTNAKRSSLEVSEHACPICGGVVTVNLKRMSNGCRKGSRGRCSTNKCLRWDE